MSDALKYKFAKELGIMPEAESLVGHVDYNFEIANELSVYNTEQSERSIDWVRFHQGIAGI